MRTIPTLRFHRIEVQSRCRPTAPTTQQHTSTPRNTHRIPRNNYNHHTPQLQARHRRHSPSRHSNNNKRCTARVHNSSDFTAQVHNKQCTALRLSNKASTAPRPNNNSTSPPPPSPCPPHQQTNAHAAPHPCTPNSPSTPPHPSPSPSSAHPSTRAPGTGPTARTTAPIAAAEATCTTHIPMPTGKIITIVLLERRGGWMRIR